MPACRPCHRGRRSVYNYDMSDYYSIPRSRKWNYGGERWRLSRSKIDLYSECPRCFYIDNKFGLKRPPGYPFSLNSAVDNLLKTEFDEYRARGEQHPLQRDNGIAAIPAQHQSLDTWREVFEGVECKHAPTGLVVSGAIDDLWYDPETEEYIVVDYKATAKAVPVTELDQAWQDGYKRQMEVYQWLLRCNGLQVSDRGYFVYCTGRPNEPRFGAKLEFDIHLIEYVGNADWVEDILNEIRACLDSDAIPESDTNCDYCRYRKAIGDYNTRPG